MEKIYICTINVCYIRDTSLCCITCNMNKQCSDVCLNEVENATCKFSRACTEKDVAEML